MKARASSPSSGTCQRAECSRSRSQVPELAGSRAATSMRAYRHCHRLPAAVAPHQSILRISRITTQEVAESLPLRDDDAECPHRSSSSTTRGASPSSCSTKLLRGH